MQKRKTVRFKLSKTLVASIFEDHRTRSSKLEEKVYCHRTWNQHNHGLAHFKRPFYSENRQQCVKQLPANSSKHYGLESTSTDLTCAEERFIPCYIS